MKFQRQQTTYEIPYALAKIKNNKTPGEHHITREMMWQVGDKTLDNALKTLLNQCLIEEEITNSWKNAVGIQFFN